MFALGRLALISVGLVVAAPAPSAAAGTVSLQLDTTDGSAATLRYRAGSGEANNLGIRRTGRNQYEVRDNGAVTAGPGCTLSEFAVGCRAPAGVAAVSAVVTLGDRNDEAFVYLGALRGGALVIHGGSGDDLVFTGTGRAGAGAGGARLIGGPGDDDLGGTSGPDVIEAGPGDDFVGGGAGSDSLVGGRGLDRVLDESGNDVIDARDRSVDSVSCGPGRDRVRLDTVDYLEGRCERVGRPGGAGAVPLGVVSEFDGGYRVQFEVGCPIDGPRFCDGVVALAFVRGRTLARRSVRLRHGSSRRLNLYPSERIGKALERRDVRLTVVSRDGTGTPRTLSHDFDVAAPDRTEE